MKKPTTDPPPVAVCALCEQIGHLPTDCEKYTGGSARLVQAAIDKYAVELGDAVGVQTKLAEAIGVAKASLTRVKGGVFKFSPPKRAIVVHYLRTGKLPATPPKRRSRGGSEPTPVDLSQRGNVRQIHATREDRYALILLGKMHPNGMAGVLADALAHWAEKHPTAPKRKPHVKYADTVAFAAFVYTAELAAFDNAVGGPVERPHWLPEAISAWVSRKEFAATIGTIPKDLDAAMEEASSAAPRPAGYERHDTSNQQIVLALALSVALASKGHKTTPEAYMDGLETTRNSANQLLVALTGSGHLKRVGHGQYLPANPQPATPPHWKRRRSRFDREAKAAS